MESLQMYVYMLKNVLVDELSTLLVSMGMSNLELTNSEIFETPLSMVTPNTLLDYPA